MGRGVEQEGATRGNGSVLMARRGPSGYDAPVNSRLRLVALALSTAAALLVPARPASADEASGTWTGDVELRGNYYWERSTRVIAPAVSTRLQAPNGLRVNAEYLVDAITSASQAAGVLEDVRFTEIRHEGTVGLGGEIDLGDAQLDLSGSFRVSREPDYLSIGGGLNAGLALNDRATTLRLGAYVIHDEIRQRFQAGTGTRPDFMGEGTSADAFEESFNALSLTAGIEQVLSPVVYFNVTYQYNYLNGFLANAYRRVAVADVLRPENHPGVRHRQSLTGRLAGHIRRTRTSVHVIYRAYWDSWDIAAITPELRVYQQLARYTHLRLRWRHYRQRRAFFYEPAYADDTPEDAYVTADPKMSTFHSHLAGFQLLLGMGFLEDTALDAFREATLDLNFEYIWNTNRFGNGVIAQVGLRIPF
ncbi:MAG: hypothetical protein CMN29_18575 [Sandaracinus sp.]|nr:hypothetical protein [Sandaracinus sp.]